MSLRKFDVFPKLDNEFRVGTTIGGILTILSIVTVFVLSFYEISTYVHPEIRQRLAVDMRKPTGPDGVTIDQDAQPKLDVTINITFHSAPCYLLHLDVIDSISQLSIPIENIRHQFTRLSKDGQSLGEFDPVTLLDSTPVKCGSCYQANNTNKICCNTCSELFREYDSNFIKPPRLYMVEQCKEVFERTQKMNGEGCSIYADFKALPVESEFHIAPGYSWNKEGIHIHNVKMFNTTFAKINLTHTIHTMKFTNKPGIYPFDGTNTIQKESKPLRVVYTASILEDNFSANSYQMYNPRGVTPGVFFQYDVSPITAESYIDREPFSHLLTRLLTVFGAVLGLFRVIDALSFRGLIFRRKEEINTK